MDSEDNSEIPSTKLAANKDDAGPAASVAIHGGPTQTPGLVGDHNRETGEKSAGNGDLHGDINSQDPTGGDEGLSDGGNREGREEGDSDLEDEESDDDNEVEYDDEDMFFEEHFDPSPAELHRTNSIKEPMGKEPEAGGEGREVHIISLGAFSISIAADLALKFRDIVYKFMSL